MYRCLFLSFDAGCNSARLRVLALCGVQQRWRWPARRSRWAPESSQRSQNVNVVTLCRTPEEFSKKLAVAMASEPQPLSTTELQALTWEAATERFLNIAEITKPPAVAESVVDTMLHAAHNTLTGAARGA